MRSFKLRTKKLFEKVTNKLEGDAERHGQGEPEFKKTTVLEIGEIRQIISRRCMRLNWIPTNSNRTDGGRAKR
eukprot:TRINITY_DN1493_c0_g1_i1.p1 TRINITY_DN1493_c0_g1~~TRINITY_DN1493_c0_g1_i1.p1  ORF type:complete len:73 (+),score=7.13 TRINITY_DN1493_c0_g1_i1:160-378(+)